ncbi:MAG TPA: selenium metabolism-associated LysR family transcriptional regulator [Coriobacteriia bacterium]|nr:selenium metabolism-associated LysR family transcriptional regulator [Coriobacteriia bacterium]
MNIAQLRAFVAVVDQGSFSGAARELAISQPAVTMQLQALESDVGATLLDRRYRRIDLTEAGRVLLPHARTMLEQVRTARDEIAALSGSVTGHLHVAASTTPGVYVVPALLGRFNDAFPEVRVSVSVHDSSDVVSTVERGEAQLGITGALVKGRHVRFEQIAGDEIILIAPPTSPLARRRNLTMEDLAEERWIFREQGSGTRQVADSILVAHGLDPADVNVVVELGTGEALVSAVEGGLGIAIVSKLVAARALQAGSVVEARVAGLPAARPFYAVLPKGTPTRAAEAFNGYLSEMLGE